MQREALSRIGLNLVSWAQESSPYKVSCHPLTNHLIINSKIHKCLVKSITALGFHASLIPAIHLYSDRPSPQTPQNTAASEYPTYHSSHWRSLH